jgi:hypothetical protein
MRKVSFIAIVLFIASCAPSKVYYHKEAAQWDDTQLTAENELLFTLYMIGDAGGDTTKSSQNLNGLGARLDAADPEKSGVVFLGDNIYPEGLHKKSSPFRAQDEGRINAQLNILKEYDGEILFVPGNHDWDRQGPGGLTHVKREEQYIQEYLDKGNVFKPSHGCPGPEVIKLAPGLVVIAIDTQWWLHQFERPSGEKDGCDVRTPDELMVLFTDLLKKYRNQNVIVAGHHPLYSNGNHGGHFTGKDHLFPITAVRHEAYIPFPFIGSIYPLYRKFLGHPQDITHPVYQDMKNKLVKAMNEYENVVYMAGHEHNLQYNQQSNIHHIISGSGSKVTHLKYDRNIEFGARQLGYSRLLYYDNGEMWLEFMLNDSETKLETIAFRKLLFTRAVVKNNPLANVVKRSYAGQFATVTPDPKLAAGSFKRVFAGDLNRDLWATPLKVPYLDIHFEKGGLTPIKKGGGMQTLSLRMQGADGHQYTLRGIQKNAAFLTEKNLRGTLAQDVIYDGMAGSHPYGSVAVPKIAEAAGVYYAPPRLVYIPKDSILGDYLEEFGGMFCLFEQRPDGNMSEEASFGKSKHVMGYSDAVAKMHGDYDHIVDKSYTLNARLFDMVIGDWDRHDDQWRWASFKKGKNTVYRPIPRDRDQVFFEFDGLVMNLVNRKWLIRKFQPFNDDIRDIYGQNFNARYFDRAFLTEANKKDWIKQAELLKTLLTDEAIEASIKDLPPEGFAVTGEEIIATLKARRDKLPEFAARYYEVLAKGVSVTGTLNDDYFDINRHDDGSVEVSIYPRKKGHKKKEKRFYHRVFQPDETKEIVLYGLDGNDEYQLKGKTKKSILVRIVGGFQNDHIEDKSEVTGLRKMTKIYETDGKNEIKKGPETSIKTMPEGNAYDYDRKDFVKNKMSPLVSIGFNANDGFYAGPGFKYTSFGFKKSPYKYFHKLTANRTTKSEGFNLYYEYDYIDVLGKADFAGMLSINEPLVYQFYGAGNESVALTDDISQYNVRMSDYQFMPSLKYASKNNAQSVNLGFNMRMVEFEQGPDSNLDDDEAEGRRFIGGTLAYKVVNQDNMLNPARGIQFRATAAWNKSTQNSDIEYTKLAAELRLYLPITFVKKQTTVAIRTGMSTNYGDYAFFQANFLGGISNFRGVQRNRYSGQTSVYNNADLRISLFKVPNYVVPFDIGLLGHYDIARVWEENEESDHWHTSYGGGLFLNVLDYIMLVATYSISGNDRLLSIGTKFLF